MECRYCGMRIFWFHCPCGCSVLWEELGPPWPKHECRYEKRRLSDRRTDHEMAAPEISDAFRDPQYITVGHVPIVVNDVLRPRASIRDDGEVCDCEHLNIMAYEKRWPLLMRLLYRILGQQEAAVLAVVSDNGATYEALYHAYPGRYQDVSGRRIEFEAQVEEPSPGSRILICRSINTST